jgi:hypothetical protein
LIDNPPHTRVIHHYFHPPSSPTRDEQHLNSDKFRCAVVCEPEESLKEALPSCIAHKLMNSRRPILSLSVCEGGTWNAKVDLSKDCITIGRGKECDVCFRDPRCSRLQATIESSTTGLVIKVTIEPWYLSPQRPGLPQRTNFCRSPGER